MESIHEILCGVRKPRGYIAFLRFLSNTLELEVEDLLCYWEQAEARGHMQASYVGREEEYQSLGMRLAAGAEDLLGVTSEDEGSDYKGTGLYFDSACVNIPDNLRDLLRGREEDVGSGELLRKVCEKLGSRVVRYEPDEDVRKGYYLSELDTYYVSSKLEEDKLLYILIYLYVERQLELKSVGALKGVNKEFILLSVMEILVLELGLEEVRGVHPGMLIYDSDKVEAHDLKLGMMLEDIDLARLVWVLKLVQYGTKSGLSFLGLYKGK